MFHGKISSAAERGVSEVRAARRWGPFQAGESCRTQGTADLQEGKKQEASPKPMRPQDPLFPEHRSGLIPTAPPLQRLKYTTCNNGTPWRWGHVAEKDFESGK